MAGAASTPSTEVSATPTRPPPGPPRYNRAHHYHDHDGTHDHHDDIDGYDHSAAAGGHGPRRSTSLPLRRSGPRPTPRGGGLCHLHGYGQPGP